MTTLCVTLMIVSSLVMLWQLASAYRERHARRHRADAAPIDAGDVLDAVATVLAWQPPRDVHANILIFSCPKISVFVTSEVEPDEIPVTLYTRAQVRALPTLLREAGDRLVARRVGRVKVGGDGCSLVGKGRGK